MANKIQQRRGLKANMPTLSAGEIGYATDTRETFIGTGSGNVNMGGSHWYRGTAMSGTSTTANTYSYSACPQVKVDDMYLNTSNGNVYACTTAGSGTSAKWTYQGSIKGATGATGATGAAGAVDYRALMSVFSNLFDSIDGVDAVGGTLVLAEYTAESCIGKTFYVSSAYDSYNHIRTLDNTFSCDLYDKDGTLEASVQQGESAIIKLASSSKAYLLMNA